MKSLKIFLTKFVTLAVPCFMLIFSLVGPTVIAQSLSPDALNSIYNDTVWYDGNTASCGGSSTLTSDLPADVTAAISKLEPIYQQAAQATNVPWQLIAGIHYRESSLSTNGSNLFQITGYSGPTDFLSQATAAGNFVQQHSVPSNFPSHRAPLQPTGNDPEEIKDTLFSYNGRAAAYAIQAQQLGFDPAAQPYEGSPYVMNNYDSLHQNMRIVTGQHGIDKIDGTDTRDGAYTIFSQLGGNNSSGGCSGGAVVGSIVQTAINYAWPDYHAPPYCNETDAYQQAIQAASRRGEYTGGTCQIGGTWLGVDCGAFVTLVMRDSQADPTYNSANGDVNAQIAYLDSHPEKYQRLTDVSGTADVQPGDIAINTDHTFIYVGKQPGFNGTTAEASFSSDGLSWRAPMADNEGDFTAFSWYRLKAGT